MSSIINDKWCDNRKENDEEEAERIVKTAAKLIFRDIRSTKFDKDYSPETSLVEGLDANIECLLTYLRLFLQHLRKPIHQASIGQSIVHVSKPRSCLAPIPFGLGVEMDNVLGSKWAIEELHSLGYSVSYAEVNVFNQSVTKNEDVSEYLKTNLRGSFTQFMCDNVDHNTMTIDGKNSFHAMGLCCATVCRGGGELKLKDAVKREQKKRVAT